MQEQTPQPISLVKGALQSFVEVPMTRGAQFFTLELQHLRFDKSVGSVGFADAEGHVAKLQRWDGSVELYYEPHLNLTPEWFEADPAYAHATLGGLYPTEFDKINYHTSATQVTVDVGFRDVSGRRITCEVVRAFGRGTKDSFTPNPPVASPPNLRLLLMNNFRFMPKRQSRVALWIDGSPQPLRTLAVPGRVATHWSARACSDLLLGAINSTADQSGFTRIESEAGFFEVALSSIGPGGGNGEFAVNMPLGEATTGRVDVSLPGPWSGAHTVDLRNVRQSWFPGVERPKDVAIWAARRTKRFNESWA